MSNYLDTEKSVIISSPAGSGKTEKLARRYIALLQKGVDVERILAVTFTDKAAAEMKQRILRVLKEEDEELFNKLIEKVSLMRVSTIHSFCGTLLRRFSFEAAIDPNYRVEDAIDSRIAWEEVLHEVLMDAGKGREGDELFLESLAEKGFRGLENLKTTIDNLFEARPFSLEADTFPRTHHAALSLVEELKTWEGVKDALEDYEGLFEEEPDISGRLVSLEKYFLTGKKEPRKRPPSLLKNIKDYQGWALKMHTYWKNKKLEEYVKKTERIKNIFTKYFDKYTEKKSAGGILDFSDLEYLAYKMLTENPEWANILYAFDEKTDHILVDEFQDINNFQWAIIDRLTEEWRSGMGAKRAEGIRPTIFFVGDEKQSIYFFRGANVEIFHRAEEKLKKWLGDEFYYEEVKENFRSRQAIIDFTNHLFSKIMQVGGDSPSWMTRYSPLVAASRPEKSHLSDRDVNQTIHTRGMVELILLDEKEEEGIDEAKQREADVLAKRIQSLTGNFQITDKSAQEPRLCRYADIALLLRKRRHLKKYEEALRRHNIPFIAVKGMGFYQEPEVAMLRALVYFLSNPKDDYSLYVLLKSPLFMIDESAVIKVVNGEGDSLFTKLQNISSENPPIPPLLKTITLLNEWLSELPYTPLSELIEKALVRTKTWRYFHEAQRQANIKKFIRLLEDLEADGKSLLKIRDFFERTYNKKEEPKANVNTEGTDAVRIMTIHAAKGLEFPVVFVPGLEESFTFKTNNTLIYEKDGRFFLKHEEESAIRRQDEDFILKRLKEEEEEKRLFYVAVTRAEEALFLISRWSEKDKSFLSFLKDGLGLEKQDAAYSIETDIQGLSLLTERDINRLYEGLKKPKAVKAAPRPVEVIPISVEARKPWKAVTEVVDIRRRHGKDWQILGDIIHRIFEGISKGVIQEENVKKMLESKGILKEQKESYLSMIEKNILFLKEKGIWQEIVMPRKDSFTELPFILELKNTVYTGRIDRVIRENDIYKIYDYKTFPVKESEMEYLLKEYSFQLDIYKSAVKELFNTTKIKSFIVFTHIGEVRES